MKAIVKNVMWGVIILSVTMNSCSKDAAEGPAGPAGPQGEQGIQGPQGDDGNANVQAFKFDISNIQGNQFIQPIAEMTASVIENDVVLGFVNKGNRWYPLPAVGDGTFDIKFDISVMMEPGLYVLDFVNRVDGSNFSIGVGDLDNLRIVIIESSTLSSKSAISTIASLKNLGVELNDYYAVCDHFGLAY